MYEVLVYTTLTSMLNLFSLPVSCYQSLDQTVQYLTVVWFYSWF